MIGSRPIDKWTSSWRHVNVLLSIDVLAVVDRARVRIVDIELLVENAFIGDAQTTELSRISNFRFGTPDNHISLEIVEP